MSDDSAGMTDEMAVRQWLRIAQDTENLVNHGAFPVRPGSELAGDDALSEPYQVSHCAQGFINSGVDHMHALKTLILGDKPTIHADSDWTLIRGALENFAVAFWVLHPPERLVRIERALRCAAENYRDQDRATKALDLPKNRPLQSDLAKVSAVGRSAGCDKNEVKKLRRLNSTAMLEYAAKHTSINPSPHLMWQVCSGFAHGRQWASLGMNEVEITPGPEEGVSTVKFTSDYKRLLTAGGYMRGSNVRRRWWSQAVAAAQLFPRTLADAAGEPTVVYDFKLHELRHTAASLAIQAGANIKALQNMLGHESAG